MHRITLLEEGGIVISHSWPEEDTSYYYWRVLPNARFCVRSWLNGFLAVLSYIPPFCFFLRRGLGFKPSYIMIKDKGKAEAK